MATVSRYDNEIFISYSHIDNQPFGDPRGGWVDIFHEQLQNFVNVHVGRRTKVWRDKRLTGGEAFSDEIEQQLRRSAILVSVISPGYISIRMVQSRTGRLHQDRSEPRQSSGWQSPAGRQGAPAAGGTEHLAAPARRRAGLSVLSRGSRVRAGSGSPARSARGWTMKPGRETPPKSELLLVNLKHLVRAREILEQ